MTHSADVTLSPNVKRELSAEAIRLRESIIKQGRALDAIEALLALDNPNEKEIPFPPDTNLPTPAPPHKTRRLPAPEIRSEIIRAIPILGGLVAPSAVTDYLRDRGISGTGDTDLSIIIRNQMSWMRSKHILEKSQGFYCIPEAPESRESAGNAPTAGDQERSD